MQIKELEAGGIKPQDSKIDTGLGGAKTRKVTMPSVIIHCSKTEPS